MKQIHQGDCEIYVIFMSLDLLTFFMMLYDVQRFFIKFTVYSYYLNFYIIQIKINMYTLYHHFLQRVKQQQIEKYNQKHRAYLIRSGKLKNQNISVGTARQHNTNQNRNKNNQISNNQNNYDNKIVAEDVKIVQTKPKRQRQFNRPNKNQIKNQSTKIQEREAPIVRQRQIKPLNKNRNQYQDNNLEQIPIQKPISSRQPPQQYDRPIKPNKLTAEQIEYLNSLNTPPPKNNPPPVIQQKNTKIVKQKQIKPLNEATIKQTQQLQQYQQIQLIQCRICGRKFKQQALQKHQNICDKVFQQKRKKFEVKVIDEQAQKLKKKSEAAQAKKKQPQNKKQKWKQQSQAFRNALQRGRGQKVQDFVQVDTRIQCPGCGRKFNDSAAPKHIEYCTNKAKRSK